MHRIVKAHLDSFAKQHGFEGDTESVQFEKFSNFCILTSRTSISIDVDEVTTDDGEDGIDGIAILIDEEVVGSTENANALFQVDRRNRDVEIVLIQAKTSESFDLGEFLKFKEACLRVVGDEPKHYKVQEETLKEANKILNAVIKNVPKIRNGRPNLIARYVTTGLYKAPIELERAISGFKKDFEDLGYFNLIDVQFVDRDEITKLWVGSYSGVSAEIKMFSVAPLPKIDGINEAYIGVVPALEVVNRLLMSADGGVRSQVFEENVRSFLGADNPVNTLIAATITRQGGANRFPVLNNGITVVSPNVIIQGSTLHLENFQIVNGCQTSHVLWENRASLNDEIMVNIKVVETDDEDIFAELVRATNSQSRVDEKQFYSLRPIIKRVEKYFDSFEGDEGRLYFERRDRQFVGKEVPLLRTFNLHNAAKGVASMFLQRPDLASRYPKKMYDDFGEQIFHENVKEIVFYAASLALYRIHMLASNGVIPQNNRKYKWHMLPIIRVLACGTKDMFPLGSNKTEKQCDEILKVLSKSGKDTNDLIKKAADVVGRTPNLSIDRLKRQAIVQEMLATI